MANEYDRIIHENFKGLTLALVNRIMNFEDVEIVPLQRKMQRTVEREMDWILKIGRPESPGLLNAEWQTDNDPEMCYRMLLYHALAAIEHKLPVIGVVIYIGKEPVNMSDGIEYENLKYKYRLIDLTDYNPEIFVASNIPEEVIMAVLAGKTKHNEKREIIRKILLKLRFLLRYDSQELNRRIAQLETIGKLREVQQIIIEEETKMALTYNIEDDIRYNQGLKKGIQTGIQQGMETGIQTGEQKATIERNTVFVKYLLQNTSLTPEQISQDLAIPIEFVANIKASLR